MCSSIILKSGESVGTIRQFQDHFKADARKFGFDGNETFIDCCLCGIDLDSFFKGNPDYEYENGEWREK